MIYDDYVDIHSHALFGVDDGSKSLEESLQMLQIAYDEGVRKTILTPHYGKENGFAPDIRKVQEHFSRLKERANIELPKLLLYLGSELYCNPSEVLGRVEDKLALSLAGTPYLLLEFLSDQDGSEDADHIVECMSNIAKTRFLPVLAHAQRYKSFKGKQHLYQALVDAGVYLQINAYDLAERPDDWTRENTRYLVRHQLAHFLGSDAHDTKRRPPVIRSGVNYLYQHCDAPYADALVRDHALMLLNDETVPLRFS